MKYSPFKTCNNLFLVSTSRSLFTILGTTLFSLSIAQSAQAISKSFNFQTNALDRSSSTSTGWTDEESTGTATKDGLSLTMTSSFSAVDPNGATQNNHSGNLSDINTSNFSGFLMGNRTNFDLISGGAINGYQR